MSENGDSPKGYKAATQKRIFKINVPLLLRELQSEQDTDDEKFLIIGLLAELLFEVARRSAEIDDAELNGLMCRLSLYDICDPDLPNYNLDLMRHMIDQGQLARETAEVPSGE